MQQQNTDGDCNRQFEQDPTQLLEKSQSRSLDSQCDSDLQRRYELLMEDLRVMKRENEEFRNQIANANSVTRTSKSCDLAGEFDWESQKRQLLAHLEGVDLEDDTQVEEKYKVEQITRVTDRIVADKDLQIAELKQKIEQQSCDLPTHEVADRKTAIAALFDQDACIQQERESLKRIQQEWRDKLRQAEIEISVERARIAREQIELETRISTFESERQQAVVNISHEHSETGRRWLAKLGLSGSTGE